MMEDDMLVFQDQKEDMGVHSCHFCSAIFRQSSQADQTIVNSLSLQNLARGSWISSGSRITRKSCYKKARLGDDLALVRRNDKDLRQKVEVEELLRGQCGVSREDGENASDEMGEKGMIDQEGDGDRRQSGGSKGRNN